MQFFEFKGVGEGLPPAVETFLMFSYPIWILIANVISKKQSVGILEVVQSAAVVLGIFFFGKNEFANLNLNSWAFLYPLGASVLIATWIIRSNRLRKEGVGTFQLSAYYDLFSLLALLVIFSGSWKQDWAPFQLWGQNVQHIYGMLLFSILVGLLPNFLFYFGSRQVSSHFAGTILALEPIFSSIYSAWLWPMPFGNSFIIGALFILLANIPKEFLVFAMLGSFSNPWVLCGSRICPSFSKSEPWPNPRKAFSSTTLSPRHRPSRNFAKPSVQGRCT